MCPSSSQLNGVLFVSAFLLLLLQMTQLGICLALYFCNVRLGFRLNLNSVLVRERQSKPHERGWIHGGIKAREILAGRRQGPGLVSSLRDWKNPDQPGLLEAKKSASRHFGQEV